MSNLSITSAAKVPNLFKLRQELYSERFRSLISEVMGVGHLTDKTDMSINIYSQSCHLVCHDDVIGTRAVAYIIYLTDPSDAWIAETDGGALELYDLDPTQLGERHLNEPPQGIPMATPCTGIPPKFNTMAMFRMQPGRSYHSVQEVYSPDKSRLSISGWFHTTEVPEGSDTDHLMKIANLGEDSRDVFKIVTDKAVEGKKVRKNKQQQRQSDSLSAMEREELEAWINPVYMTDAVVAQLRETFAAQECIQLHKFLSEEVVADVAQALRCETAESGPYTDYNRGVSSGWNLKGPSHKRRYLVFSETEEEIGDECSIDNYHHFIGVLMSVIRQNLFYLPSFAKYLSLLTGQNPTELLSEIRRFRPGLDYSIAHMGMLSKQDHLDFNLCFVDVAKPAAPSNKKRKRDKAAKSMEEWQSGDLGGFVSYVKADESLTTDSVVKIDADEVFNKQESKASYSDMDDKAEADDIDENLTTLEPGFNVLSIVLRKKNQMHFVKYLNSSAGGSSRWDISVEAEI